MYEAWGSLNVAVDLKEINGLAAYAAAQHPAFHDHLISCCESMANDDEDYEGFRSGFYKRPDMVAAAGRLQLQFQPNATPGELKIRTALTSLLSAVNDDRGQEIIKVLKGVVLDRERFNLIDAGPASAAPEKRNMDPSLN